MEPVAKPADANRVARAGRRISTSDWGPITGCISDLCREVTERGRTLLDRPGPVLEEALRHPRQLEMCVVIGALIAALRDLETDSDCMSFQQELLKLMLEAQEYQAETARNEIRVQRGKAVPAPLASSWEVERVVADRLVRQLHSIGDAFAWHLFRFDRRVFIAFATGGRVSPMIGRGGVPKEGLGYELGTIMDFWRKEGRFGLLHDLTSVMRLGDVTLFTEEKPMIYEVKKSPKKRARPQLRRLEDAIGSLNSGQPSVDGDGVPSQIYRSSQQFRTRLGDLGRVLEASDKQGTAAVALAHHWVVTAISLTSPALVGRDFPEEEVRQQTEKAFQKASMHTSDRHLRGVYLDVATVNPWSPPYAIFPFEPDVCARLTCDLLVYVPVITYERLAGPFIDLGFDTRCLLSDPEQNLEWATPLMSATKRGFGVTVHWGGMGQLLHEMLEPKVYASATAEVLEREGFGLQRGMFVYSNEKAVWR